MTKWKVILNGPDGTPYQGGRWLITIDFPSDYPFSPPKVRFATPIYHCNINDDGRLCLDVLKDMWSPSITIPKLFATIESLLQDPNPDDPLDAYKATLYKDDRPLYLANAIAMKERHASMSMEDMVANS